MPVEYLTCKGSCSTDSIASASTQCPYSPKSSVGSSADEAKHLHPLEEKYGLVTTSRSSLKVLGKGEFGEVYEGFRREDGFRVAIKMLDRRKSRFSQRAFESEVKILGRVADHPNVLKTVDVLFSDNGAYVFIVTELCDGGTLWDYLRPSGRRFRIPEDEARQLFMQLLDAVEYIHRNGVVHLDLKAENICVCSDGVLKIIDFGLSQTCSIYGQSLDPVLFHKTVGTPICMAPEVQMGCFHGPEADMWSLGVVLYEMLTYKTPFQALSSERRKHLIWTGSYDRSSPQFTSLSPEVRSLFKGLFTVTPSMRLTLQQVRGSPWMNLGMPHTECDANYTSAWATLPQRLDIYDALNIHDNKASTPAKPIEPDCSCTGGIWKLLRDVLHTS